MPENTADFDIPKPLDSDKPPSLENSVGPGFDRIDELLGAVDLSQLAVPGGAGDAGKFIVVDGTGAAAYKAMSGDVSLGPTGATQIGNDKIVTSMLQDKTVTGVKVDDATLSPAKLMAAAKPLTWYTPKIIATEESRSNPAFGTLTTADEIKEVVVPENGLLLIGYEALWKGSVDKAKRAAIFLNSSQLRNNLASSAPAIQEIGFNKEGTTFTPLVTTWEGLFTENSNANGSFVTTGSVVGVNTAGGFTLIRAAAGTYNISVQYKSSSGSVTAKERKLWVAVLGS